MMKFREKSYFKIEIKIDNIMIDLFMKNSTIRPGILDVTEVIRILLMNLMGFKGMDKL